MNQASRSHRHTASLMTDGHTCPLSRPIGYFYIGITIAESNTLAWLMGAHRTRRDKDAGVVRRI